MFYLDVINYHQESKKLWNELPIWSDQLNDGMMISYSWGPHGSQPMIYKGNICIVSYKGIVMFDIKDNVWKFVTRFKNKQDEEVQMNFSNARVTGDPNKNTIFIQDADTFRVIKWNEHDALNIIHSHKFERRDQMMHGIPNKNIYGKNIICVHSVCHGIANLHQFPHRYSAHTLWDDDTNQLKIINEVDNWRWMMAEYGINYWKQQNKLLLFGCKTMPPIATAQHWIVPLTPTLVIYDIFNNSWNITDNVLKDNVKSYGHVITQDQYLITLGGCGDTIIGGSDVMTDSIWITPLKKGYVDFYASNVKLPKTGVCQAVIMDRTEENDLLTNGWIKEQFSNSNNMIVPFALIKLCMMYHSMDYIHAFVGWCDNWKVEMTWKQYQISVDKILAEN